MSHTHHFQIDTRRNRTPGRSIDYLKIRLRRMVVSVMKQEQDKDSSCPLAQPLADKNSHWLIKGFWLTLSLLCFAVFAYQLYDRISYYFLYPIAVDVYITQPAVGQFPDVTICYAGIKKVLKEKEYSSCNKGIESQFHPDAIGRPFEDLWKEVNTSTGIISAHEIKGVYLHDHEEDPTTRTMLSFLIDKQGLATMAKRTFVFLNRKASTCLTIIQRQECLDDCLIKQITKIGAVKCRFPFYPLKMNNISSQCSITLENFLHYINLRMLLLGLFDRVECYCPRKCEHTSFNEWVKTSESTKDSWTLILRFSSPYETMIKERMSYDLLDLFCDVGGNSGLFIGISLLSLFQLGHMALRSGKKWCRPKSTPFSMKDPLYRKVVKTYQNWRKSGNYQNKSTKKTTRWKFSAAFFKTLIVLICVCFLVILCGNRLWFYFQYPMKTIVHISFNTSLEVPILIFCYGDENVMQRQLEIARSANISNHCDVNVWDLFNLPTTVSGDIWRHQVGMMSTLNIENFDLVPHYDGSCYELVEELVAPFGKLWTYSSGSRGQCGTGLVKVYIKSPTRIIDYHRYTYLSPFRSHTLKYLFKEIHLEKSGLSCITPQENDICIQNCLNRKLFNLISCRLPYMPQADLPLCRSSSSVRQAHTAFRDIFFISENAENCNCLPKCITRIMEMKNLVSEVEKKRLNLEFSSQDNIVESYVLIPSYSFVKLLCDIGGLLGSFLGICILDIIETAVLFIPKHLQKHGRALKASQRF